MAEKVKLLTRCIACLFITFLTLPLWGETKKPNFIIFIADDVSWDDLACYGNKDVQTPNIDKFCREGTQFWNTYLTASSCSPSRNSIMLGRYPHNTGAAELHSVPEDEEMNSLPGELQKAGYYTLSSGKFHMCLAVRKGLDRSDGNANGGKEKMGPGGHGLWLDCLEKRPKDKPFFAWFAAKDAHRIWDKTGKFAGTHDPKKVTPPDYYAQTENTKKDFAEYYDEITRFDDAIDRVVKKIKDQGEYDNTIMVIMADNGRPFPHSKGRVNDRGMKTPFIMFGGGVAKNKRCDALVSVIDIAPTFLELAGTKPEVSFQGVSFAKLLKDPKQDFRNYIFAEHNWHDYEAHERMVRNKDFMYILNSRPELANLGCNDAIRCPAGRDLYTLHKNGKTKGLQKDFFLAPRPVEEFYDLNKDPEQRNNVAQNPEYHKQLKLLKATLELWMKETGDSIPEKLTKDWYQRTKAGSRIMKEYKIRGEMPGAVYKATTINHKGPF